MTKDLFRFTAEYRFEKPLLIAGWTKDSGALSPRTIDYLNRRIKGQSFCAIDPSGFFSLAGVAIENNVAQFPERGFYYSHEKNLVLFKADEPQFQRYQFLSAILDVAEHYCKAERLYTVNGVISSIAHTSRRHIFAVFNQPGVQKDLRGHGLVNMTWQGPPHLSTYLLWLAKRRNIAGTSLWVEVPFYLAGWEDLQSLKTTLSFFSKRIALDIDLENLNQQIDNQNQLLAQLRENDQEINQYISGLESGLSLSEEEQMQLIKGVSEFFKENR